MIHDFQNSLNDISEWEEQAFSLDPASLRSPNDKSIGYGQRYSAYERYVCPGPEYVDNPLIIHIPVFRFPVKAKQYRYHAFLPNWVCPFLTFTYPFLIQILSFYFGEGNCSKKRTAMHFKISRSSVYTILRHFENHDLEISRLPPHLQFMMDPVAFARQLKEHRLSLSSALKEFMKVNIRPFLVIKTEYRHFGPTRPYLHSPHGGNLIT